MRLARPTTLAILVCLLGTAFAAPGFAQRDTLCRDRQPQDSSARIATVDEPGTPLVVTGTIFRGADKVPVAGARLLAFQTDDKGYYSVGGMDERNARLCAVVRTAADGSYRFETIRPAHYATGGPPAHIHFELTLPGERMRRFDLNFEGDPKLGGRSAGETWDAIRPAVEDADGVQHVRRDYWVR